MDRSLLIRLKVMVPSIFWLCSMGAYGVTGQRYVAVAWNCRFAISDARAMSEALIAWPGISTSPVWPEDNADKKLED